MLTKIDECSSHRLMISCAWHKKGRSTEAERCGHLCNQPPRPGERRLCELPHCSKLRYLLGVSADLAPCARVEHAVWVY